jgi:hypothetical protein
MSDEVTLRATMEGGAGYGSLGMGKTFRRATNAKESTWLPVARVRCGRKWVFTSLLIPFWIPSRLFSAICCFPTTAAQDPTETNNPSSPKGGIMTLRTIQLLFSICFIVFTADSRADCARPALAHQRRDAATMQRPDGAWSLAYLTGDAEFGACLTDAGLHRNHEQRKHQSSQ